MVGPVLTHLGETKLELGRVAEAKPDTHWRSGRDEDDILWLALDKPGSGTNTVSEEVLRELSDHIEEAEQNRPKALVIRSAKLAGFAAGADIEAVSQMAGGEAREMLGRVHDILDRLERLDCPTIAVVHGAALGAGFELALACDFRVAIDGASFGFPEVQLGLHPGLGGTYRLTGLIDPTEAMTLMLTGKSAHISKARKLGIADVVTEERHVRNAVRAIAADEVDRQKPGAKARALSLKQARSYAARQMRKKASEKAPEEHYPAPYALIDLWEEHGGDRDAMRGGEIDSFATLLETDTCRNLIRVFLLRQKLKDAGKGESGIAHVHVVGAGEMGGDIATWAAISGKRVTLGDVATEPLGQAVKDARETCKSKHLSGIETRDALDRLMPDPNGYGVARADLVIEAAPEDPDLKRKIYSGLAEKMKAGAILASNTSSLRLEDLAEGAPDTSRFAGLHFFNPVPKMQLVEVVGHGRMDDDVGSRLAAFCGEIDRLPATVEDYPGFLVNRALTPYLMETLVLIDEGVDKEVIDRAAVKFGMPMGPVALSDQIGLDICLDVAESLKAGLDKPMAAIPDWLRRKVDDGELGKKTGQGFYDWSKGPPKPGDGDTGPEELTDRLVLPLIDACVECLRKGVAKSEDQVDGAMIFATGFAPFRGGPMHYARMRGATEIRERLAELADRHGPRFAPDEGWSRLE